MRFNRYFFQRGRTVTPEGARKAFARSKRIEGWFEEGAAKILAIIDEIQRQDGLVGDIFEIGCHHGRSALFLAAMVRSGSERMLVCDIFEEQSRNMSHSGRGDRAIFDRNVARAGTAEIEVVQKPSGELRLDEIGANFRIFHIDGGHSCEEALSDLRLAAEATVERGVIVLDDPFRPEWPGVTEAVMVFLGERLEFSAFLVAFNKLLIARRPYAIGYQNAIRDSRRLDAYRLGYPSSTKEAIFLGSPVTILYRRSGVGQSWNSGAKKVAHRIAAVLRRVTSRALRLLGWLRKRVE